jgi:hypothetical protein
MAAVETASSSTGVQCRVDQIVTELRGYIASGVISMEKVASLLQVEGPKPLSGLAAKNVADEQPSVTEINVSTMFWEHMIVCVFRRLNC